MSLEPQLLLYTKPNCSLCVKAKADLKRVARKVPFQIQEINITQDEALFAKYRHLIPVGELSSSTGQRGEMLFVYRVDPRKLKAQLRKKNSSSSKATLLYSLSRRGEDLWIGKEATCGKRALADMP